MFKKLPKKWLALRQDLAVIITDAGEKITVTQDMTAGAFYFETKKGNYKLGLNELFEEFIKFREKEAAALAHHALTGE